MPLPESVVSVVKNEFPPHDHQEIFDSLSTYGTEKHHREVERVLLDILYLAKGNKKEVVELVERAKRDYRDIIYWAEYPDQSKLDSPKKIEEFNKMLEKFGTRWRMTRK